MLYFVLLVLAVGVSCDAGDIEYEYASGEPLEGSSLDTYRYYLQESSDGDSSSSYQEEDVPKKREIPATAPTAIPDSINPTEGVSTHKPKIALAALIGQVEGTIFQSALSVATIVKGQNSSESVKPSEATGNQKRSAGSIDDLTSEQDTIFKYVTSRSVPAKENQPPHYIVDEIAVSKLNAGLGPLISSLDFHIEPTVSASLNHETKSSVLPNEEATVSDMDVTVFVTPTHDSLVSITSVKSSEDGNATKATATESTSSTTAATTSTSSSTAATPTSTTLKTPIEKLKEAEDSLKEKVAEIEAEPVILSARV